MIQLKRIRFLLLLFAIMGLILAPIILIGLIAFSNLLERKLTKIYEKYGRDIATKLMVLSGFSGIIRILKVRA